MSTTPEKSKRKWGDIDFTPDKMEYKISKSMADTDMEAVINGADLDYIVSAEN